MVRGFNYRFFVSCSQRDDRCAKWLQAGLEAYRIDPALAGRDAPAGPLPKNLRPIFRSRDPLANGALTERTAAALQASQYLIVLCSPAAAASPHVNEEIRRFKAIGRADRLFAVILDGEPGDPARECVPPALRFLFEPPRAPHEPLTPTPSANSDISDLGHSIVTEFEWTRVRSLMRGEGAHRVRRESETVAATPHPNHLPQAGSIRFGSLNSDQARVEPSSVASARRGSGPRARPDLRFIREPQRASAAGWAAAVVADLRPGGDRKALTVHRLVATIAGLPLVNVVRHAEEARQRRFRVLRNSGIAALLALTLAYEGGAALIRYGLSRDPALLERTLAHGTAVTSRAVGWSRALGLPGRLSAELLAAAEGRLGALAALGPEIPQLALRRSAMLIELSRLHGTLGDREAQRASASAAERLLARLAAEGPGNLLWQREVAAARNRLGDALLLQGRFDEALASYQASYAVALRLATADSHHPEHTHELALRSMKLGNAHLAQGLLDDALEDYQASLAIGERLLAEDRNNPRWQHGVLLAQVKIADVLHAQGDIDSALAVARAAHAFAERLVTGAPRHAPWQRALAVSHRRIGDLLAASGKLTEALASFAAGHGLAARLAAADPHDPRVQSELAASHSSLGRMLEAQGEPEDALDRYGKTLAILGRLAAADPDDLATQRELGIAYEQVGDVLRTQGELAGARAHYEAKKAIFRRLAAADPDHGGWQYDLGTSHARMGYVLEAQGDYAGAAAEYEACLAIVRRFAAAEPGDARAQRDLAASHGRLAANYHRSGKVSEALAELRKGRAVLAALAKNAPDAAQWTAELAHFDGRIAALEGRGPAPGAPTLTVASAAATPALSARRPARALPTAAALEE